MGQGGLLDHLVPQLHVTPERGWLNDPNGPAHHAGRYHLFFQAHPHATAWGPPEWGHVSSADLVRWRRHPTALRPSRTGPDRDGCWSGCVRTVDGRPTAFYTGVTGAPTPTAWSPCAGPSPSTTTSTAGRSTRSPW